MGALGDTRPAGLMLLTCKKDLTDGLDIKTVARK